MINTFENACVVEDTVYFFSYEVNALFAINMTTKDCECFGTLQKYENKIRLFGDLIYVNGKLILVPTAADDFVIYDVEKKTEKYIPIRECNRSYNRDCKFFAAVPSGTDVYFIGCHYPAIAKLDLITEKVTYYTECLDGIGEKEQALFRHDYYMEDDKFFLACSWTNKVMSFDIKKGEYSFFEVGSKGRKYAGITYDGECYWLTPFQDNIVVQWDRKNGNYKEIKLYDDLKSVQRELSYAQSFMISHYIIMLPLYTFPVCIIDTNTGKVKIIKSEWISKDEYVNIAPIRGGFVYNDFLYIINSFNGKLYNLDIEKMNFNDISLDISMKLESLLEDNKIRNKWRARFDSIVMEDMDTDLNILLYAIHEEMQEQINEKTMCGDIIEKMYEQSGR